MSKTCKQFRKRNAILAYLKESKEHPSAETIFTHLKPEIEDLSLGTVYRNLTLFKQQGLAVSLGTVNGVERFDGNTDPHVHFICTGCDAVVDLSEVEVPASLSSTVSQCTGACVAGCQLTFTGTCRSCLAKEKPA